MEDDDDLTTLLAPQQRESGGGSDDVFDGRTAINPQTGERIIWRGNRRTGSWRSLSEATASPAARTELQNMRGQLGIDTRVANLADEHVRLGNTTPTGGWRQRSFEREQSIDPNSGNLWNGLNFPSGLMEHGERSRLETMRGLEGQALRAQIREGTSGTINSPQEQALARSGFPSITALGDTNSRRTAALFVNRDLQQARIRAAEQWLTQRPDLSGFEEAWREHVSTLRPQLEARYSLRYRIPVRGRSNTGSTIGAEVGARNRDQSAPAGVSPEDWQYMTPEERALWQRR